MKHFIVFGEPFDFISRARDRHPGCEITLVIEERRAGKAAMGLATSRLIKVADGADHVEVRCLGDGAVVAPTDVVALVDHLVVAAAHFAEEAELPFHTVDTVVAFGNKGVMRAKLEHHPDLVVRARSALSQDALVAAADDIGFPVVVKPVDSTGSRGISVVHDECGLRSAWERAAAFGAEVLVEEYLSGPQYSVESFSEDGEHVVLAVTRKFSDPRTFVEVGHVLPAPLESGVQSLFERRTIAVLDELGLRYGPSHTEFVLTVRGPVPIETHARVGGDDIYLMVRDALGVDMDELQVAQILGDRVIGRLRPRFGAAQAIWFGASLEGAVLDRRPEQGEDVPGFDVRWLQEHSVAPLRSSGDRALQVRAAGATADEALERARSTAEELSLLAGLSVELTQEDELV